MATLASDEINEVQRLLLADTREAVDILNGTITSGATTLVMTDSNPNLVAGALIEIDTELMYVRSISGTTVTVARGWRGSTAAAHTTGAYIYVNPKFPSVAIMRALNEELASLSSPLCGLFRARSLELTYTASISGYNLTGLTDVGVLDIYDVRYNDPGSELRWPSIKSWRLRRASETDDFASGLAIVLDEPAQPGAQLRVIYKGPFTAIALTTDDMQSTVGLPETANDIPVLGAAMRLTAVREVSRNFTNAQGDTRRGQEVPVGSQLTGARGLQALWQRRVREEAATLARMYPPRLHRR